MGLSGDSWHELRVDLRLRTAAELARVEGGKPPHPGTAVVNLALALWLPLSWGPSQGFPGPGPVCWILGAVGGLGLNIGPQPLGKLPVPLSKSVLGIQILLNFCPLDSQATQVFFF